jgi:hypothetical protein
MIARILSRLFPPRLPSPLKGWEGPRGSWFNEQGSAGPVRPGPYRDALERYDAENHLLAQPVRKDLTLQ